MLTDEAIGGRAEGECKAEEVVEEAAGGGVEDIGEHDIHGVFGANGAGTEHGEAKLHGEDEISGEKEVSVVDGIIGVGELVVDVGEFIADEGSGGGGVGAQELSQLVGRAVQGRHERWILPITLSYEEEGESVREQRRNPSLKMRRLYRIQFIRGSRDLLETSWVSLSFLFFFSFFFFF